MDDDKPGVIAPPAIIDEDQPTPLAPDLPPEIASPLAAFKGQAPEAPAWFHEAVAQRPERTLVPVAGANIELLVWGELGAPGLILVHGNSAHADWWRFSAASRATWHRLVASAG